MRPAAVALAAIIVLALAACGGGGSSKQDKAKSQVCDARADIAKQVDTLKGITNDLKQIAGARNDLSGDNKSQLEQANKEFVTQINSIASSLLKSTSLSQAQSQAKAALSQLSDAYQQTFAKFSCD